MIAPIRVAALVTAAAVVAGCGSDPRAADTSSRSYKLGLESGAKGWAGIQVFNLKLSHEKACQDSFTIDSGADPSLNKQDYMAGCLYGLTHKSAVTSQTPTQTPERRRR